MDDRQDDDVQAASEDLRLAPDRLAPDRLAPGGLLQHSTDMYKQCTEFDAWVVAQQPIRHDDAMTMERITEILMSQSCDNSPTSDAADGDDASMEEMSAFVLPPSIVGNALPFVSPMEIQERAAGAPEQPTTVQASDQSISKPKLKYVAHVRKPIFKKVTEVGTQCMLSVSGSSIVSQPYNIYSTYSTALPIFDTEKEREKEDAQKKNMIMLDAKKSLYRQSCIESKQDRCRGADFVYRKSCHLDKGVEWGQTRYNKILHYMRIFKDDEEIGDGSTGFLTHDMLKCVRERARNAVQAVLSTEDNGKLKLASAMFWTLALSQEAWRRTKDNPGWFVESEKAQYNLSWEHLEYAYLGGHKFAGLRKASTCRTEEHYDEQKQNLKTTRQLTVGVKRTVESHELGATWSVMNKKMIELDRLLKKAGDIGLAPEIVKMQPPTFMKYPRAKQELCFITNAKQKCLEKHSQYRSRQGKLEITEEDARTIAEGLMQAD